MVSPVVKFHFSSSMNIMLCTTVKMQFFGIHEYDALLQNRHFSPFTNMMVHLCQTVIFWHSWIWWCTTAKNVFFSIHKYDSPLPNCHFSAFMNMIMHHCQKCIFGIYDLNIVHYGQSIAGFIWWCTTTKLGFFRYYENDGATLPNVIFRHSGI